MNRVLQSAKYYLINSNTINYLRYQEISEQQPVRISENCYE